jgi:CubicO group peptidase (beta-lactamase class C family)
MQVLRDLSATLICLALSLGATPADADMVPETMVAAVLGGSLAPGAGAGVYRDGKVAIAAKGLRAKGRPEAVEEGDLWHIGSDTKSMTATLVARLAEAGRINWDDTVGAVLGGVIDGINPAYASMTYADLLSHRSGLAANLGLFSTLGLAGSLADRDMMTDRRSYAGKVLTRPPEGTPGAFLYSNAGYVVAGAMLQQTTGQTWEALIAAEVFDPLGLASAGFGPPGTPGAIDQPRGHKARLLGGLAPVEPGPAADNVPALGPAGTVHLSIADMMRYLAAHAVSDPAFLSPASWVRLHSPPPGGDYAMGWNVEEGGRLAHNGSNTLWFARMAIWPNRGRAAFLVANYADFEVLRPIMQDAVGAALGD